MSSDVDSGNCCGTPPGQIRKHGSEARVKDLGKKIEKSNKVVDSLLVTSHIVVTTIAFTIIVFCILKKKFS